jgi:SAM-dependent MidA family methyltransferase
MRRKDVPEGFNELPSPSPDEQAHSQALIEVIGDAMAANGGSISFADYMDLVLYAPGLGYYSAGKRKFGAAGDFITAPEISPLFSRCLARQCQQVLTRLGADSCDILEFGAGTGVMAAEILRTLAEWECLPRHYYILDVSADLREQQRQTLKAQVPEMMDRVIWLDRLPGQIRGVVLANEVLDAMPVHRIGFAAAHPYELFVGRNEQGGFVWRQRTLSSDRLQQRLSALFSELGTDNFYDGYVSEINLAACDWLTGLAAAFGQGLVVLIDYGFPRHEYYHPERHDGTLMCHYRHRSHDDPLILPGLQDITSHVDFTSVAETAVENDLDVAGYTSQAQFLLGCGLPQLLEQARGEELSQQISLNQQIKKLTLPHEMGELFKVIALTKRFEEPLIGFALNDQRGRL